MKGKKVKEWLTNKKFVSSCAAIALAAVIGGVSLFSGSGDVPEFPSYTDPVMEATITEEETPLASQPKTTVKTTKRSKTTTKTVKLKKASSKTYTKKLKTKTKVTNTNKATSNAKVATKKTVVTNTKEKYTKKSKTKKVVSKVTTTVQTTTTKQVTVNNEKAVSTATTASTASSSTKTGKYEANITSVAGKMDSRVIKAFQQLGFKINVDPSVSYSGYFEARSRSITMREIDDSVYHELGHFLAFIAGNADKTAAFQSVYAAEKESVTSYNKAYVTQNASEYFAESVKDFILNNSALKSSRPQTYEAVQNALNMITDAQIAKIQKIYGPFWK